MSTLKRNDFLPAMPSMFNDFLTKDLLNWGLSNNSTTNTTIPAVNIKENADNFIVEVAAPGMDKNDFKVELNNNILTIGSEKENTYEEKESERFNRKEFSYQSFQRMFHLPKDVVNAEGIQARYENGVLQLVIPKKDEAKQRPPRRIEIS